MRSLEERIKNTELEQKLERRRMDGVAAEIAKKVDVLLQDHDVDAGASEQKPEHQAGGTAAGDCTLHAHRAILADDVLHAPNV
jgi:hypothetical protein